MPHTIRTLRSDARANRAGILDAAREALARDPHASIDLIARNAGLSRRALYGHFPDRATLLTELIATGAHRFNDVATQIGDEDSRVALARLAARLWDQAEHVRLVAATALDETHLAGTAAALQPLRHALLRLVIRGQRAGELRTDIDAPLLARLIEETARTALTRIADAPESPRTPARGIVVRTMLSVAGLSWREVEDLLAAHPEVLADASANGEPLRVTTTDEEAPQEEEEAKR